MAERSYVEEQFTALAIELNLGRAAVLSRCGRRADVAIAACHALIDRIEAGDRDAAVPYEQERRAAVEAVDRLCLQFEMLRVYDHTRVHESYPVPLPLHELNVPAAAATVHPEASETPVELHHGPASGLGWWDRVVRWWSMRR